MYQVLLFKFRHHLCKGSIASQNGTNVLSSVLLQLLHAFQSREFKFNRIEDPYDYLYHLYQMEA